MKIEIEDLKKVQVNENDVILVTVKRLPASKIPQIRALFDSAFPNNKVVLMNENMSVEVCENNEQV